MLGQANSRALVPPLLVALVIGPLPLLLCSRSAPGLPSAKPPPPPATAKESGEGGGGSRAKPEKAKPEKGKQPLPAVRPAVRASSTTSPASTPGVAAGAKAAKSGPLRVRNRTPFILLVYVGGVRVGWIRPFQAALFRDLKAGYHSLYALSQYGTSSWGPEDVWAPGTWNVSLSAGQAPRDLGTALASRVYNRNRSSLVACDRLAERRGEAGGGSRVDFEVAVDGEGKGAVKVSGDQMTERLRSCYLAVARQWEYPSTGAEYVIEFQHTR